MHHSTRASCICEPKALDIDFFLRIYSKCIIGTFIFSKALLLVRVSSEGFFFCSFSLEIHVAAFLITKAWLTRSFFFFIILFLGMLQMFYRKKEKMPLNYPQIAISPRALNKLCSAIDLATSDFRHFNFYSPIKQYNDVQPGLSRGTTALQAVFRKCYQTLAGKPSRNDAPKPSL